VIIDDLFGANLLSNLGTRWEGVSDEVMGGLSKVSINSIVIEDKNCLRLSGQVCLDNNGGFIQAALNLDARSGTIDASKFTGIFLVARGNDEKYSVHIRTPDNTRAWQSYRSHFIASSVWNVVELPFSEFIPHRLTEPLDVMRLRRIGIVAIGRKFYANLTICKIGFYQ
jgi:hypothetical protein